MDYLPTLFCLQVDRDAALIPVARLEIGVPVAVQRDGTRTHPRHRAPDVPIQRLYLDYVRAHVSQHGRRYRAELVHSPVEHTQPLHRTVNTVDLTLVHILLPGCHNFRILR